MITPEIAAYVVKEYLLPMFESDGKRLLSKKKKKEEDPTQGSVSGLHHEEFQQLMDKDYS